MIPLDRASPLPLWAQLQGQLRERIQSGEFDRHFPTDEQLVREYRVSRQTIREAIRSLQLAGLVKRERGRGSYVPSPTELEQPLSQFYSLAASIHEQGLEERSVMLDQKVSRNAVAASHLGLAEDTDLVEIRRLRYAGDEPLAIDDSWLPLAIGAVLLDEDLRKGSIYEQLALRAGTRVTRSTERIRAASADAATRKTLALPRGEAVLVLDRLVFMDRQAVEWRRSLIRGDRFTFVSEWNPGTP